MRIPIIRLRNLLIISVQTELTDAALAALRDDVSHEIAYRPAKGLVIEVSGVGVLDSYISSSIQRIAQIARLMGVHTVVAGINASMAITLVEMGMGMSDVRTALNLDAAVDMLEGDDDEREIEDAALLAMLLGEDAPLEPGP